MNAEQKQELLDRLAIEIEQGKHDLAALHDSDEPADVGFVSVALDQMFRVFGDHIASLERRIAELEQNNIIDLPDYSDWRKTNAA